MPFFLCNPDFFSNFAADFNYVKIECKYFKSLKLICILILL